MTKDENAHANVLLIILQLSSLEKKVLLNLCKMSILSTCVLQEPTLDKFIEIFQLNGEYHKFAFRIQYIRLKLLTFLNSIAN